MSIKYHHIENRLLKAILSIILIAVIIWGMAHYAMGRKRKEKEARELHEKYKNNYDSIYLSDLQIYYREAPLPLLGNFNFWRKTLGHIVDTLGQQKIAFSVNDFHNYHRSILVKHDSLYAVTYISLYDDTRWRMKLSKENLCVQSYQGMEEFLNRFKKSALHAFPLYHRSGRRNSSSYQLTIFNADTTSIIEKIQLQFWRTQIQHLLICYRKKEVLN